MYLAIVAHIIFPGNDRRGELSLRQPSTCQITSSWELLTDNAIIRLPRNTTDLENRDIKDFFRAGDAVEIWLGYNGALVREFTGYISHVDAGTPVVLECEDEMYLLKKHPVEVSYKEVKLATLLQDIVPSGIGVDAGDISLGAFRMGKTTAAKVLKKLADDYNVYSFIRDGQLVSGKVYVDDLGEVLYGFEDNIKESNLEFILADDRVIKVDAESTLSNGAKIKVSVGEEGGETHKIAFYGIGDEATLKKRAEEVLEEFKTDGYEGSFHTFGIPAVKHGMVAVMTSKRYPERDGKYFIKSVTTTMSDSPPELDREIELDRKSSDA